MEDPNGPAVIVITTYAMISRQKDESRSNEYIKAMKRREWGLLIADEVHCLPAENF